MTLNEDCAGKQRLLVPQQSWLLNLDYQWPTADVHYPGLYFYGPVRQPSSVTEDTLF